MREKKKKTESTFAKHGFFITLTVIVGIMLISVVMNMVMPDKTEDNTFDSDSWQRAVEQSEHDDGLTSVYNENAASASSSALPSNRTEQQESAESTVATAAENAEAQTEDTGKTADSADNTGEIRTVMVTPLKGSVMKDFSDSELQFSETMNDWRAHLGIDFAGAEGTEVAAAADGTVEKVLSDSMLGTCVIIAHPDGLKTLYGNLQEGSAAAEGTQLKAGETVGKVGKTAALEILEPAHLHFEVLNGDKNVSPYDYLPDLKPADESDE